MRQRILLADEDVGLCHKQFCKNQIVGFENFPDYRFIEGIQVQYPDFTFHICHIFICKQNPLAQKASVTMEDLKPYPYLSFEQGEHNSFYYSEEIFSTEIRPKNIRVRDRATLFNLLIGLNGYTVCSGIIDEELNDKNIIAVPLDEEGEMHIGYITRRRSVPSRLGSIYLEALKQNVTKSRS